MAKRKNKEGLLVHVAMQKNKEGLLPLVRPMVKEEAQARLSKMNRLSALALTPSNAEIERDTLDIVSDITDAQNEAQETEIEELKPAAEHGKKFTPKRKKGALSSKTKYIHKLVKDNHTLCNKQLFELADTLIIGDMRDTTFSNIVAKARKAWGLPKSTKPAKSK